jgi:hypothetical protein
MLPRGTGSDRRGSESLIGGRRRFMRLPGSARLPDFALAIVVIAPRSDAVGLADGRWNSIVLGMLKARRILPLLSGFNRSLSAGSFG